jgi:histidinol-phosphate aminotransferase
MLTQGSAEGLFLSADTFIGGGTLVGEWPAYRIIRERVWQQDGTVVDVPLRADDSGPDYEGLKGALHDHPDAGLVHFNVQNNPVGPVLRREEFEPFAAHVYANHPNTILVADESDAEFMEPGQVGEMPDFAAHVADGRNLVHIQTFSHAFGLTGLRAGYLMAPPRLISRLRQKRIVHPISVFAHAAALASLRDRRNQIARSYAVVDEGRRYIYDELGKLGLHFVRSQGQYVFFDTGLSGTAIWLAMIGEGVLTRYGREWGRESWMRVNPGLPDENTRFIASLKAVLGRPDVANLPQLPVRLPLPGANAENGSLARGLLAGLRRDTYIDSRIPRVERPYRVIPAAVLRRPGRR